MQQGTFFFAPSQFSNTFQELKVNQSDWTSDISHRRPIVTKHRRYRQHVPYSETFTTGDSAHKIQSCFSPYIPTPMSPCQKKKSGSRCHIPIADERHDKITRKWRKILRQKSIRQLLSWLTQERKFHCFGRNSQEQMSGKQGVPRAQPTTVWTKFSSEQLVNHLRHVLGDICVALDYSILSSNYQMRLTFISSKPGLTCMANLPENILRHLSR